MSNSSSQSDLVKPSVIRAELEAMVLGDLLGPAGGENEELTERTVRDRYIVGARGLSAEVGKIYLSDDYLKNAGQVARIRAAQAGCRLAEVWKLALGSD